MIKMKFTLKLIIFAILSFSLGIACASPLLVSEKVVPWITYVQGPTADMTVQVVYANFTLQNSSTPITQDSAPTIFYNAILNITNPSEYNTYLSRIDFLAAQQIVNNSNPHPINGGEEWSAKGIWLDGKWYNLTYVTVSSPSFDADGTMHVMHALKGQEYWMEGVRLYDRYINGSLAATYLDMNGTWVNVTDKLDESHSDVGSSSYSIHGMIVNEINIFSNTAVREYSNDGSAIISSYGGRQEIDHLVSDSYFDNNWAPQQSRLFAVSGNWTMIAPFGQEEQVMILQSGQLMLKTSVDNSVDIDARFVNNTVTQTWSTATELKQVQLTQMDNSYIYTTLPNASFITDKWGLEAFLDSGS